MRAAYDGALQAGQGGAAAIAAACAVLVAQVPGLTPFQVGEALGAVVVAAGAEVGIDRERDRARGFSVTESGITVVGKGVHVHP